jgi:hypothetical protein
MAEKAFSAALRKIERMIIDVEGGATEGSADDAKQGHLFLL